MGARSRSKLVPFILRMCLNYIHCAIATTLINPQLHNSSSPALKNLNSAIGIDPRLKLWTKIYEGLVPSRSCLMNAVEALAFLAEKDYHGTTPQMTVSVPGYTDVQIVITPAGGAPTLPVKPAVLGLYLAVLTMSTDPEMQDMFHITTWFVLWDDAIVAWIFMQHSGPRDQIQAQNLTGLPSGTLLKLNDTTPIIPAEDSNNQHFANSTNPTNADVELIMSFYPWGTPLREMSVFKIVLATLLSIAKHPSTDLVADSEIEVPVSDVTIRFAKEASTGLTGPPSFEYRWVIGAVKQIPLWMVHHRWWESFFTIEVNGYVVGEGWVRRALPAGQEGNLTTS